MEETATPTSGVFEIDLNRLQPYEAVALALTVLAYPLAAQPDDFLSQRYEEVCAFLIRRRASAGDGWAEEVQQIRPTHALVPFERVERIERELGPAIEKCLTAGRMAIPFIEKEALGAAARLPPGVARLSQVEMSNFIFAERQKGTPVNIKNREFYANRSVLHLCAALAWTRLLISKTEAENGSSVVDFFLSDVRWLRVMLLMAQGFETAVLSSEGLNVPADKIVLVRWIDFDLVQ